MRKLFVVVLMCVPCLGCNDDNVDSDEEARRAYLGLDRSLEKSFKLGFDGFSASAGSANIPPQVTVGDVAGTLGISGQVDSGASMNKGMRLNIAMVDYDDGDIIINEDGDTIHVVYNTDTVVDLQPYMQIMLKNFPTGTFDGTLMGVYHMTGAMVGDVTLNVTYTGNLMPCTAPCVTERVPGSTHVIGTATNPGGGVYNIDLTI